MADPAQTCTEDMGSDPCGKPAVGFRLDPTEGLPYLVCRKHLRATIWVPDLDDAVYDFRARRGDFEECDEEIHSWRLFNSEQVDSYYMRCHLLGPHEEHENSETGAKWK